MKRVIILILLVCILFIPGTSTDTAYSSKLPGTQRIPLSSLDENGCVEFLAFMGVSIPKEFSDRANIGSMAKNLITELESDPDRIYAIGSTVAYDFIEDVRMAVKEYHRDGSQHN